MVHLFVFYPPKLKTLSRVLPEADLSIADFSQQVVVSHKDKFGETEYDSTLFGNLGVITYLALLFLELIASFLIQHVIHNIIEPEVVKQ